MKSRETKTLNIFIDGFVGAIEYTFLLISKLLCGGILTFAYFLIVMLICIFINNTLFTVLLFIASIFLMIGIICGMCDVYNEKYEREEMEKHRKFMESIRIIEENEES